MKEAIGNTFLTTLAILFLSLIMLLLVYSLVYSKAYKAKNKIVSTIVKYKGFTEQAREEIDMNLFSMGYKTSAPGMKCRDLANDDDLHESTINIVHDLNGGDYDYCVYEITTDRGLYYHVVTFMHFDIPIIGSYLNFEVKGDTRIANERIVG